MRSAPWCPSTSQAPPPWTEGPASRGGVDPTQPNTPLLRHLHRTSVNFFGVWRLPLLQWPGMANHKPQIPGPTHGAPGSQPPTPPPVPMPPSLCSPCQPSSPPIVAVCPQPLAEGLPPPLVPPLPHPTPCRCPFVHSFFHPLSAILPPFLLPPLLRPTPYCCPSVHPSCHPLLAIMPPFPVWLLWGL